jgi:transposase
MAFIRKVRTGSGATAVQIAAYIEGRQRIIKHIGSAHAEANLGVLLEQARRELEDETQGVLNLGVDPTPVTVALVEGKDRSSDSDRLFDDTDAVPVPPIKVRDGTGRVLHTGSYLLFDLFRGVFTDLGFDTIGDNVFRDLVISRIVEPTSLLDSARVLRDLGQTPAGYATMKRTLNRILKNNYRDRLAALCFAHVSSISLSLVLYDVTTLRTEAEKEDGFRMVGYSKERRIDPQIVVGLLVDRHGFPLEIAAFEGNKAEKHTIIPVIKQFIERHKIENIVVVTDAGMLSGKNLKILTEEKLSFIVGSRTTKAPIDLESRFYHNGNTFTDGQIIDTITPINSRIKENNIEIREEPVWDQDVYTRSWRAIWVYSTARATRDTRTLDIQEKRARAVISGEKQARTPRFVKVTNGKRTLDTATLERARKLIGLKGYVTNIPATDMSAREVINSYHDLWTVEQSFRISKTDLRAHPMFHRVRDAIEAHLTIVFTALAVSKEAQTRTGLTIQNIVRQLRPLRSATIAINGTTQTFAPAINPDQQTIINNLQHNKLAH